MAHDVPGTAGTPTTPLRPFARPGARSADLAAPAWVAGSAPGRPFGRPTPTNGAAPAAELAGAVGAHDLHADASTRAAAALERIAVRLRGGELTLPPGGGATDAATLALVLAALLTADDARPATGAPERTDGRER